MHQTLLPIAGLLVNILCFQPALKLFEPLKVALIADEVLLEILRFSAKLSKLLGFHDLILSFLADSDGL